MTFHLPSTPSSLKVFHNTECFLLISTFSGNNLCLLCCSFKKRKAKKRHLRIIKERSETVCHIHGSFRWIASEFWEAIKNKNPENTDYHCANRRAFSSKRSRMISSLHSLTLHIHQAKEATWGCWPRWTQSFPQEGKIRSCYGGFLASLGFNHPCAMHSLFSSRNTLN